MSEISNGGPAFPVPMIPCDRDGGFTSVEHGGMTLRDYFAINVLNGLLSYSYCNPSHGNYIENCSVENAARQAYQYADAMLEARKQ